MCVPSFSIANRLARIRHSGIAESDVDGYEVAGWNDVQLRPRRFGRRVAGDRCRPMQTQVVIFKRIT